MLEIVAFRTIEEQAQSVIEESKLGGGHANRPEIPKEDKFQGGLDYRILVNIKFAITVYFTKEFFSLGKVYSGARKIKLKRTWRA